MVLNVALYAAGALVVLLMVVCTLALVAVLETAGRRGQ